MLYARSMLLALETSDRNCAVCLADPATGGIVASITEDLGRGHAERLMGMIDAVFETAGCTYQDLTCLAACVGPGSFTGIRVALATATGLSIALGIPVLGVTALQAIALEARGHVRGRDMAVLIDAHRGDVYLQMFSPDATPVDAARQIAIDDAASLVGKSQVIFAGNGVPFVAPLVEGMAVAGSGLPSVEHVAHAALDPRFTVEPKPLYLRRPDAKPQEAYTERRALRT